MSRIHVAVLRGGPSTEYDVSLATGGTVIDHLPEERYKVRDILIDRNGEWHSHGLPVSPGRALNGIDVVFNALHGTYGEDGSVQKILETHGIPYTGSGVFSSSVAMDKGRTRAHVGAIPGVKMPMHHVIHTVDASGALRTEVQSIFERFGPPYIIKPLRGGSSVGIEVAHSKSDLEQVLKAVLDQNDAVIVEQFISGKEGTCGVVEHFRDQRIYSLPPVEIRVPKDRKVFDYEAKYTGITEEVCPGNFTAHEKETMQHAAQVVHEALGLSHYSRSDFILAPSGVHFLEVNTLPGLTNQSLLPKSLDAVGVNLADFLDHVVTMAQDKHTRIS